MSSNPTEQDERLDAAIAEYMQAEDEGTPIPVAEFLARFPEVRDGLVEFLASQGIVAAAVKPFESTANGEPPPGAKSHSSHVPPEFGEYQVWNALGEGGMGIVLAAFHLPLKRKVALKVLKAEWGASSSLVTRFKEEARIASQLQHPGIAPVHEIGNLPDGRPFFAMKMIVGKTLAEMLDESLSKHTLEKDRGRYLIIFEQICQTIAFAHSRSVVHRDLKPANVMVGAFGEVQVMDWGLGKVLSLSETDDDSAESKSNDHSGSHTRHGKAFGTYPFIPPEQANGQADLIGPASDVFGLGAILCCLLTGQPPYASANPEEVIAAAVAGDISSAHARLTQALTDADLLNLAKRCLAPDPAERPTASDVAGGVRAYLDGVEQKLMDAELGKARAEASSRAERRRRKAQLISLAAIALFIVTSSAGGIWLALDRRQREQQRIGEEIQREQERTLASERIRRTEADAATERYFGLVNRSRERRAVREGGWVQKNLADLKEASQTKTHLRNELELRTALADCLTGTDIASVGTISLRGDHVKAIASHPDGRYVAVGYGTVVLQSQVAVDIVDLNQQKVIRQLRFTPGIPFTRILSGGNEHGHAIRDLKFSPNGRWLVGTSNATGKLYRWDWSQLQERPFVIDTQMSDWLSVQIDHQQDTPCVYVHPVNGKRVRRWQLHTGAFLDEIKVEDAIRAVILSPSGRYFIETEHSSHRIYSHLYEQGKIQALEAAFRLTVVSPDERLAYGNSAPPVIGSVESHLVIGELRNQDGLPIQQSRSVAFSGDSRYLGLINEDMFLVYSGYNQHEVYGYRLPRHGTFGAARPVSAAGKNLFLIPATQGLHVCRIDGAAAMTLMAPHDGNIFAMALNGNGRALACLSADRPHDYRHSEMTLWPTDDPLRSRAEKTIDAGIQGAPDLGGPFLDFSPDGEWVYGPGRGDDVRRKLIAWHPGSGKVRAGMTVPQHTRTGVIAPDGTLWTLERKKIRQSDPATDKELQTWEDTFQKALDVSNRFHVLVASPRRLTAGDRSGNTYAIDLTTMPLREISQKQATEAPVTALAIRRGKPGQVFAGDQAGNVRLLDEDSLATLGEIPGAHAGDVSAVSSLSESLVVTAGRDATVKFWRLDGFQPSELFRCRLFAPVKQMLCSPDKRFLYVLCENERCVRRVDLRFLDQQFDEYGLGIGLSRD